MEITSYNRQKITILGFVSIVFVLYIHSYYLEAADYPIALWIQRFVVESGLSAFAVPLFYFISGLLLFNGLKTVKDCIPKIHRRVRSLLVPYIIWNLIFVGWYIMLAVIPPVQQYVNSDIVSQLQWRHPIETLNFLFISPAGFHLWFLRDLILYVILSPLLFVCLKRFPIVSSIILFFVFGRLPRCGITYFAIGGVISLHCGLEQLKTILSKPVVYSCMVLFVLSCLLVATFTNFSSGSFSSYIQQIRAGLGIISVWGGYDILVREKFRLGKVGSILCGYTFFIYLFHEPTFNIIKKLGLVIFGCNEISLICLFLINPILMCLISIAVGYVFKKIFPKIYSVVTGGR